MRFPAAENSIRSCTRPPTIRCWFFAVARARSEWHNKSRVVISHSCSAAVFRHKSKSLAGIAANRCARCDIFRVIPRFSRVGNPFPTGTGLGRPPELRGVPARYWPSFLSTRRRISAHRFCAAMPRRARCAYRRNASALLARLVNSCGVRASASAHRASSMLINDWLKVHRRSVVMRDNNHPPYVPDRY